MDYSAEPEHAPHPPAGNHFPRKAERPNPGTLIPGTSRLAAPSAASASVAAPPSRTRGASDPVLHQRSGRQAPVSPRTADLARSPGRAAVAERDRNAGSPSSLMLLCLSSLSFEELWVAVSISNWLSCSPFIWHRIQWRRGWSSLVIWPRPAGGIAAGQKLAAGLPRAGPGAGGSGGMLPSAWRSARLSWPVASPRASMRAGRVQGLADSRR